MLDALQFDNGLNTRWREAVDAHKRHAEAQWPNEAVGLITWDGQYRPCMNIAADPVRDFEISEHDLHSQEHGWPAALLHSHTSMPDPVTGRTLEPRDSPTAHDMRSQMDTAIPWGISLCVEGGATDPFWFGDQVPKAPLLGRTFRHGVQDCYAYIRDWHSQVASIEVKDFPRDVDWWEPDGEGKTQDLYLQGFEEAGFVQVNRAYNPLPGDVFLCKVKAPVMNHGGVYLGDGLIGHHLLFQLSNRTSASLWRPKLDFLVRHRDLPDDWEPSNVHL